MTIKERIEEILPDYVEKENEYYKAKIINETIRDCREKLQQAVSEGKLCLDPPTREELEKIANDKWYGEVNMELMDEILDAIFFRIRNGREE